MCLCLCLSLSLPLLEKAAREQLLFEGLPILLLLLRRGV